MAIGSAILSVFRFIWRALDGVRKVLHLVLLLFLFLIVLAFMSTSIPIVPGRAALVLDIHGPIVEQYTGDPLDRAIGRAAGQIEAETRLRDILVAIEAAADDDRIKLIVLNLKDMSGAGL